MNIKKNPLDDPHKCCHWISRRIWTAWMKGKVGVRLDWYVEDHFQRKREWRRNGRMVRT